VRSVLGLLRIQTPAAFGTGSGRAGAGLQTVFLSSFDSSRCRERGRLRPSALLEESSGVFVSAWKYSLKYRCHAKPVVCHGHPQTLRPAAGLSPSPLGWQSHGKCFQLREVNFFSDLSHPWKALQRWLVLERLSDPFQRQDGPWLSRDAAERQAPR